MDIVTTDLSKYGFKELSEAGELLKTYADDGADFLGNGVTLNFNTHSGKVFLSDEDYNVGVIEHDDKGLPMFVQFYSCPNCGYEGTQADAESDWTYSQTGKARDEKDFVKFEGYCSKECLKENN